MVIPTVLPTVSCRGPRPGIFVGALWPTACNTIGTTTPYTVHHPMASPLSGGNRLREMLETRTFGFRGVSVFLRQVLCVGFEPEPVWNPKRGSRCKPSVVDRTAIVGDLSFTGAWCGAPDRGQSLAFGFYSVPRSLVSGPLGASHVQWFRGGLVFEAQRRLYRSPIGSRVIKRKSI